MPNLFRHLIESNSYETLKSLTLNWIQGMVQDDKIVIATQPLGERGDFQYLRIEFSIQIAREKNDSRKYC